MNESELPGPSRSPRPGVLLLCLGAILLLAAVVRLVGLGDDSLWNNEVLSFQRASEPNLATAYALLREGTHPPLYSQGVLRPWFLLGDSEWMQRLPSAVFGLLTVWGVFRHGRRRYGAQVGIVAAGLLAFMPLHLYYSREGRMYALLALLVTLWVGMLSRAVTDNRWRSWFAYALIAAASLYTHYYAGLSLLAANLFTAIYLLARRREGAVFFRWCIANAGALLLFLPWLPTLWYQLHNDPVSHLRALSAAEVLRLPVQFFTAFETVGGVMTGVIAGAIACLLLMAFRAGKTGGSGQRGRSFDIGLLLAVVLGTLMLAELVSLLRPIVFVRYFVGILPAFALLLAVGVVESRPRSLGYAALVVLLVTSAHTAWILMQHAWRPEFKAPVAELRREAAAGDVLVLIAPADAEFKLLGFQHHFDVAIPVLRSSGQGRPQRQLRQTLDAAPAIEGDIWVLQHQRARALEPPAGFRVADVHAYPYRFFTRQERNTLTHFIPAADTGN